MMESGRPTSQLRISGKDLGELALPNFCPRCFWIKYRCDKKLPFQKWPGIFSSIDSYTKKVMHGIIDQKPSMLPNWLNSLGDIAGYIDPPHFSKFKYHDRATNVLLTGSADGIFIKADKSLMIVDYKTAKFTGAQDDLMPIYDTQLNAYALIAEHIGLGSVTDLALIYMEPLTDERNAKSQSNLHDHGFGIKFEAKILKRPLDTSKIIPLLRRMKEICELRSAPAGLEKCDDCSKLNNLLSNAT